MQTTKPESNFNPTAKKRTRCLVCANFAIQPLNESLAFWVQRIGLPLDIEFSDFDQLIQVLLAPTMPSEHDFTIILVQLERWFSENDKHRRNLFTTRCKEFTEAVASSAKKNTTQHLVVFCPPSPPYRNEPLILEAEASFLPPLNVEVFRTMDIMVAHPVKSYEAQFDSYTLRLAAMPYSRLGYAWIGAVLARGLRRFFVAPRKVIVADCDNTLWTGICSEDGPGGVTICNSRRQLQEFLLRQRDSGRLLCLCSKNEPGDVLQVLEKHSAMAIRRQDLTAVKINWEPKYVNMRALAAELSLSLDSFAFIDDDPVECAAMRFFHPEVLTIQLPPAASELGAFLAGIWELDSAPATSEDKRRTQYYSEDAIRSEARRQATSLAAFYETLGLKVQVRLVGTDDINRAVQLMRRTNQFNLNGVAHTAAELGSAIASGIICEIVHAADKFGDYGDIGFLMYQTETEVLLVETFVVSCRALGKQVEHRIMDHLKQAAVTYGKSTIKMQFRDTSRNHALNAFLVKYGFEHNGDSMVLAVKVEA
jgi:FkbH-like protein